MPTPKRVTPWHTLSIAQGNVIQLGGLLGAAVLAWYAGHKGVCGTRWMVASRLLAYFSEHAFSHWLIGRTLGIRFTGYGLHGTSHPQLYPPGMRWVFSHLPFLSARIDPASLRTASPAARGDVRCRHRRDRDPERRNTRLPLAARRPTSARLLHQHKPVERAAAPERVTASRRGSAAGVAGGAGALGVGVGK
jgi:hypothetical protein